MPAAIEKIPFSRFINHTIPFEVMSIGQLYDLCKKEAYDLSTPHRIAFNALIIVTKGESKHMVDFKDEVLIPGTILPLQTNQVHAFSKIPHIEGMVISFEEQFITRNVSEKHLFHFLHIFNEPSILIGKENLESLTPFINLLVQLHSEDNPNMKSDIISSQFMALLLQLKRLSFYQHKTFENQRFKDFIKFKQLISLHYSECHDAKNYAKKINVSYKYLNDICKEIANKTAKTFIDEWLLLEIKRSLFENKYTSQEIAYKTGFKEPSNFIRFFKKHTQTTPNQFQNKINK